MRSTKAGPGEEGCAAAAVAPTARRGESRPSAPAWRSSPRKEAEEKTIPKMELMVSAHANVTHQQKRQVAPPTSDYFSLSPLLQAPTGEDLGVVHSIVPSQALSSLETPLIQSIFLTGSEQSSAVQTETLRDFEKHLNDLKKENFSLKLRIYFLEERMQQKYEAGRDDIYRRNIELKVEVESLKKELQEKQKSLDRAWVAAESLGGQNEAEICEQQESEWAYGNLEKKIHMLQEEVRSARTEAEQMTALAEAEKEQCLELNKKLTEYSKKQDEARERQALLDTYNVTLAEKDKKIEELTWQLSDKEKLLTLLSREKQNLLHHLEKISEMEVQNWWEDHQQFTWCDSSVDKQASELNNAELLEKIHHSDSNNKLLQEKLNEMDFELKSVQQTSLRQDHKIQNLSETLKSKETESEELYRVIEGQNETITKLQDMLHRSQLGQLQTSESSSSSQQKQQMALLEMQNTLFLTQLEAQQAERAKQQKDRRLSEHQRANQLLETRLQEEQQQKEAAWKHNWELRTALQELQTKLQNKKWQCWTLEKEKSSAIKRQEQKIKQVNYCLAYKEQHLQECKELLQYHQNSDQGPTSAAADMVQKLQQRIKERDVALEQAIDEKFHLVEEKEQELQQIQWSLRQREHDVEALRRALSSDETTIQGLESMLKARSLELEQLSATCQNLQWLKEEIEAKSQNWQVEQDGIIQQLRTTVHDRNKEVEALSAALQCKLGPGHRDIVEELCFRLQQKERIIQELLTDRNRQAKEQKAEIQNLLQTMSAKEQQSRLSSEKMAQALIEKSCELQILRQQLMGQIPGCKAEGSPAQYPQEGQSGKALMQGRSNESITTSIPKGQHIAPKEEKGVLESNASLEKELLNVKEELELLARKEGQSRMELSALQSVVVSQEEELQVQASDVESLTRSIQVKEELIKDLQMQLVDPEEMPAIERLTQEVLMLREKVAQWELQGQEIAGIGKQQLLLVLEELAAEKDQLNEALQTEKQLYSTLVKFHSHPGSTEQEQTLQVELERAQALHKKLEEALGRTLERLLRLDSLDPNGGGEHRVTVLPKHAL